MSRKLPVSKKGASRQADSVKEIRDALTKEKQHFAAEKQQFEDEKQQWEAAKQTIIQYAKKEADIILMGAAEEKQQWEAEKQQWEVEKQKFEDEKQQWEAAKKTIIQEAKKEADSILAGAAGEKQQWEAEKAALAGVQHFESVVKLDVGGVRYTTTLTTLRRFPDSMIGCMFSGKHALSKGEDGYFFIDRDGTHFRQILYCLRSPEGYTDGLEGREKEELRRECEYYGIDQLMCPPLEMGKGADVEAEMDAWRDHLSRGDFIDFQRVADRLHRALL